MAFQTVTNAVQAPGVAGDFASANPRATVLSYQNQAGTGISAGPNGLTIGLFAWLDFPTYLTASNSGSGAPNGFVHREQQALITTYLSQYGSTIPAGFPAPGIFDAGDFFVLNNGTTEAVPGQKAYANNSTGVATFAATGAPTQAASATGSTIAAGSASFTGVIADNVLTASAVTGLLVPGEIIAGTGVFTGTQIIAQLTGTANGAGTYSITPREQTVASEAMTGTYGLFTAGTVTGTFAVGQTVSGSGGGGVAAGTVITGLGTGTGGTGTYYVNLTQTVTSSTITSTTNTETGWYCRSFGLPGELVKISSRAMG